MTVFTFMTIGKLNRKMRAREFIHKMIRNNKKSPTRQKSHANYRGGKLADRLLRDAISNNRSEVNRL